MTVSHDRVIRAARKAGGNAARRHKRGGRVDAPDPRAGSLLARKAATAWHAGFAEVHGAAAGAESKAMSGYGDLGASGMISLDIPPGAVDPVPGGVDDHHVTVAYLGKNVDDDAFEEACQRSQEAASRIAGPLSATLSGIGSFPPDERGKRPVFIPASIPGGDRLRNDLADLSASQHPDWNPHVTLAYQDEGDEPLAPQPHKVVTFTHLSVHRGDDVRRFPFGGATQATKGTSGTMETKVGPKGFVHGWHFLGVPGTGDAVHHPSHGKGIVTAVDDKHVSVRFGSGAERTFEHSAPKPGKASGFVKRGDHEAGGVKPAREAAHTARPGAEFSPGYLRGEGATDSDVAELARRYMVMHGKAPTAAEVAKIERAKPGKATTAMSRDEGLAKARSIHEADKAAGGGHLPPLALLGNDKHADGSVSARAVDHQGRDYAVKLGADKTVTVTHKGKSLTEPSGANPTQKARELAGKLTAPAPAEARPNTDDFWAHEQPKAPPAPPAPKPKFDQGAMFAEPDKLGTAPMFGDKFGTSDITKPNTDALAPAGSHAATARGLAGNVRLEGGLSKFQREEAETRLNSAARHLDAGNHAEAVAELDAAGHATEMRGGGVIKGSTAAKARDLAAQVRTEHGIAPEAPEKPVKWSDIGGLAGGGSYAFGTLNGHRMSVDYGKNGKPHRVSVDRVPVGEHADVNAAKKMAEDHARSLPRIEAKENPAGLEVKDLAASITSATGRESAVRDHLAVAGAAIEGGDVKTAYGALDMARRHALGEFGANPDRPVLIVDKTEAWRPIIRLRDSVRATAPRDA